MRSRTSEDGSTGGPYPAPVFIMGCRRSGTTLLSRLLNSHRQIAIYHESFLYSIFEPELRWYGDLRDPPNLRRLAGDVRAVLGTQVPDVPEVDEIVDAVRGEGFPGVFGALMHLHALREGKSRGGDKTPGHYRYLSRIRLDFPDSPILFVIRDPRDVVHSIRRVFDMSLEGAAGVWNSAYRAWVENEDAVVPVVYESLVSDPQRVLGELCEAAGEEFDEGMLSFHRDVPDRFRGRVGGEKLANPIDTGSIGRHREMAPDDIRTIERLCAVGMARFGYEPAYHTATATPAEALKPPPAPGLLSTIVDRLRYYGVNRNRWRRGWARWRIVLLNRIRHVRGKARRNPSAT